MRHSPQIRLIAAKRDRDLAEQACPHWDFEHGPDADQPCCDRLYNARNEVKLARRLVARSPE
jgi:hypothetical protein